jgi:hypothetical protein
MNERPFSVGATKEQCLYYMQHGAPDRQSIDNPVMIARERLREAEAVLAHLEPVNDLVDLQTTSQLIPVANALSRPSPVRRPSASLTRGAPAPSMAIYCMLEPRRNE